MSSPKIRLVTRPRLEPGKYFACCKSADIAWNRGYRRWNCEFRFDVFDVDGELLAEDVKRYLNLGTVFDGPEVRESSEYFHWWTAAANGNGRQDFDPAIFLQRTAEVEVADNHAETPYSIIKRVIRWDASR